MKWWSYEWFNHFNVYFALCNSGNVGNPAYSVKWSLTSGKNQQHTCIMTTEYTKIVYILNRTLLIISGALMSIQTILNSNYSIVPKLWMKRNLDSFKLITILVPRVRLYWRNNMINQKSVTNSWYRGATTFKVNKPEKKTYTVLTNAKSTSDFVLFIFSLFF